jgi:hypothetical protein
VAHPSQDPHSPFCWSGQGALGTQLIACGMHCSWGLSPGRRGCPISEQMSTGGQYLELPFLPWLTFCPWSFVLTMAHRESGHRDDKLQDLGLTE